MKAPTVAEIDQLIDFEQHRIAAPHLHETMVAALELARLAAEYRAAERECARAASESNGAGTAEERRVAALAAFLAEEEVVAP